MWSDVKSGFGQTLRAAAVFARAIGPRPKREIEPAADVAMGAIRAHVRFAVLFSAAINLLYLTPSIFMLQVYDRVVRAGGAMTLIFLSFVAVLALLTLAILDALRARVMSRLALRLDRRYAEAFMRSGLAARTKSGPSTDASGLRDLDTLRQTATSPAMMAVADLPWTPLFIIICFVIHFWIGIVALSGALIIFGVALLNERSARASLAEMSKQAPAFYAGVDGDLRSAETVRTMGLERALIRRRLRERETLVSAQTHAAFTASTYTAATRFSRLVLQSTALAVGGLLAVEQLISPGSIVAASILTARAFAPVEQVVAGWRPLVQAAHAYNTLRRLIANGTEKKERTPLPKPKGYVRVEALVGCPPGSDRVVLRNISFDAAPGEIVGILGPSGAGKTALARLLANAAIPVQGAVRLDGARYADWDKDSLGEHVGYLPQEIALFPGTIAENICRFRGELGESAAEWGDRVVAAAQAAGAHDVILRLPNAYETRIGAGAHGLSLGQAQRVALARSLFGAPTVIVLDEPNAHLDGDGENALVLALKAAKERGAVCFVVAHRSGVMTVADKLLVLRDGVVADFGPRDQVVGRLAAASGLKTVTPVAASGAPS